MSFPTSPLGGTDLTLTRVGLGAWAIGGGDWCFGWGPQSDDDSIATIRRAIEAGINWIDTSSIYGLGRSESVIGRALRRVPRCERPYVFSKCGYVWDELGNVVYSLQRSSVRRELDASLMRLGAEAIDLYQIDAPHGAYAGTPHAGSLEEAWSTLADVQRDGKVRFIGVCGFGADELARLEPIAPVASLQARYSVLRRGIEHEVLPYCAAHGIGVIASSPMESGLLTGAMTAARVRWLPHNDWRRRSPCFHAEAFAQALRTVPPLRIAGARRGVTPGAVAIAWTLRHPAVTAAAAGARRPEQISDLVAAGSIELTPEEMSAIETGTETGTGTPFP
jgi:aryl-alcohol dehydrogenase-like predicted oxidoreductase